MNVNWRASSCAAGVAAGVGAGIARAAEAQRASRRRGAVGDMVVTDGGRLLRDAWGL